MQQIGAGRSSDSPTNVNTQPVCRLGPVEHLRVESHFRSTVVQQPLHTSGILDSDRVLQRGGGLVHGLRQQGFFDLLGHEALQERYGNRTVRLPADR